jgi:hypothetical protein
MHGSPPVPDDAALDPLPVEPLPLLLPPSPPVVTLELQATARIEKQERKANRMIHA